MSVDPGAAREQRPASRARALERRGVALLLLAVLLWILWRWLKQLVWSPS